MRAMTQGTVVQFGVLVATVFGLWVGARLLVASAVQLARRAGFSDLVIGLTVVAIGTSTPEFVVSIDAALAGAGDVAVANVVGSNVYNLAFILGTVSLIEVVPVERSLVHRDGLVLAATTLGGFAAMADLTIGRFEGLLFVGSLVAYTGYLVRAESARGTTPDGDGAPSATPSVERATPSDDERGSTRLREGAVLIAGLAVVLLSGHYMVEAATTLARSVGISQWVIGGTIVAAGTSTPEFAVSLVAMRQGSVGVSVGNVVGSNVFNMVGVLGIAAVLRPLAVPAAALESMTWLTVLVAAMVAALWSGRKLSRAEGGLFALSELLRWGLALLGIVG